MKPIRVNLPVLYKGSQVQVGFDGKRLHMRYKGNVYYFIVNPRILYAILFLLAVMVTFELFKPLPQITSTQTTNIIQLNGKEYRDDVMGYFIDYFDELESFKEVGSGSAKEEFLVKKQMLISKYLIRHRVSRLDQLNDDALLEINQQVGQLFIDLILQNIKIEPHVFQYFTDTTDLKKIETALMEQAKYNVPASIKLAQSALETAYGRRVINNNYFGIKDKMDKVRPIETTEYYSEKELKLNKNKVISQKKVVKNGKTLYKCRVKDSFAAYQTPWESFRAHSVYLSSNKRYSPLFTKGKDYSAWAEKIGSSKYGGVGYATSPIYGNLLKKIIRRYQLDLLDH